MNCPFCGKETKVVETRESSDSTRRRRECLSCEKRFTTYERVETTPIIVIKKDGRREAFDREKLMKGIIRACEKRKVSLEDIEKLIDDLESRLSRRMSTEVKSREIGEMVMTRLKKLDKVAYIRFASVYRDFSDLSEFEKEIKNVGKK